MALFRYQAFTVAGRKVAGVIDADSLELAKERLVRQQVMVTHLAQVSAKNQKEITLSPTLLLSFTRELGQLLNAGLPLYECLVTIEEKYRQNKSHPLFLDLCDRLKGGSSFSICLKKYGKTFDAVFLSMVQAGERGGSLPFVFEQMATLITRQQKLKKQLISALTYPGILFGFCLLVVASLLFFVIPSLEELFDGRTIGGITQVVIGVSRWVNAHTYFLFFSIIAFIFGLVTLIKSQAGRLFLQQTCIKLPFLRSLLLQSALVRFCRSSAMLLDGGVPLIEALRLARKTMKLLLLEKVIENAENKIVEGKPLSLELKKSPLIPPLVSRMLSIAEETGKMGSMLYKIAEIYDEDLEKDLAHLTTFLQPALLLTLGAIVGLVVLSILLPLTDVGSFLQ